MIIIYFIVIALGFVLPFISCVIHNKRNKILSLEKLFYSYIFFIIGFIFFSKIFYIFLEFDFDKLNIISNFNFIEFLKFILSGYSFIGGYLGGIFSVYLFSKLINERENTLISIYTHSLLLMYGVLKIGCFIIGCCEGKYEIPIQLIESIVSLTTYCLININLKKYETKKKLLGISLFSFGMIRFLLSFFRIYSSNFCFIIVQLICLIFIIYGIKNYYLNKIIIFDGDKQ